MEKLFLVGDNPALLQVTHPSFIVDLGQPEVCGLDVRTFTVSPPVAFASAVVVGFPFLIVPADHGGVAGSTCFSVDDVVQLL